MKILNKEFLLIINKKIFLISYFLFLISYFLFLISYFLFLISDYTTLISGEGTFGLEILTAILGTPLTFISIFFSIIYFFNLITRANVYLCLKFKFIFLGFLISCGLMILGIGLDKSDPLFSLYSAVFLALPLILHISYLIYCKEYNYIIPGIKENKLYSIFIIIMIFFLLNFLFKDFFN